VLPPIKVKAFATECCHKT